MEIIYRKVNLTSPDEMREIAAIDMSIPASFDSIFEVNEATISERLEQLMKCKPDDFFEVAVSDDGKIVGFHFMNKFKGPQGGMAANIQTLWVHPDTRKRGIAKTLKQRGEIWAKEQKLSYIWTFVNGKNSSMLKLAENFEYELVGHKLRKCIK